jgi:glutathione S-transferase
VTPGPNPHGLLLYDFPSSPCARRVRITLLEKGLAWDTQMIDLSRLAQRDPAYLALNPNGFVPTLAHGERVVWESNVITEYLEDVFPAPALYPRDPWALAQVRMWQAAELAMAKDHRPLMYQRIMGPLVRLTRSLDEALAVAGRSTTDPADLAWEERVWRLAVVTPEEEAQLEARLLVWLDRLERVLAAGPFLAGDRFTQAEISVYPRVAMLPWARVPIGAARHPHLRRWMAALATRPSFARTRAPQDVALARLSRTPLLPWLGRVLRKPAADRTVVERAGRTVLRAAFRRAMRDRNGMRAGARPIRLPRPGAIPPTAAPARMAAPAPAEPDATITLWDWAPSPHARRIRILLRAKGLAWTAVAVDVPRLAHKAPDYLALNPDGEVPTLRHGDRLLHDSAVIAEYLDQTFAGDGRPRFYPADAFAVAEVRMWLALEAGTHKELRPLVWLRVVRPELERAGIRPGDVDAIVPAGVHPSHRAWLRDTLRGGPRFDAAGPDAARAIVLGKVDRVEGRLAGRDHLVGDVLTMADVAWYTRLDGLGALGIALDEGRFPHVRRWMRRLEEDAGVPAA